MRVELNKKGILAGDINLNEKINALLDELGDSQPIELVLDSGEYQMTVEQSVKKVIYMTNTVAEDEMKIPDRQIGIYLENRKNLTIDGNGSTLIYHGRMTEFALINCKNVVIKNFKVDFDKATVAEFTITKISGSEITCNICADSGYKIENGKLLFDAIEGIDSPVVLQECDIDKQWTRRIDFMSWLGNSLEKITNARQNVDGSVTFNLLGHLFREGYVIQACKTRRDACGTFIDNCENISLINNQYYFMHGMGILSQLSKNVTIEGCNFTPNRAKGRTTTAFADMIHCSMCSGDIIIRDCVFDGARDDIVNVHGNHYLVKRIVGNKMQLKFCHPQAYGFLGIRAGETLEFIKRNTLVAVEKCKVVSAKMIDKYITEVELERAPTRGKVGMAIENFDRTPNLLVENIKAYNIPTRGILVTTKGKVVIRKNLFNKMYMSAILIADDAKNWFESGYVRDVLVENNVFNECCTWIIDALPEAHSILSRPVVHKNIRVVNNTINHYEDNLLRVKRTDGFTFEGNIVTGKESYKTEVTNSFHVLNQGNTYKLAK